MQGQTTPQPDSLLLCQVCGTSNEEDQEYCRRCQHKLLVLSGPFFEEDAHFDPQILEETFSFDEHLLERISVLEEVVKRSTESLRQLLGALRKQEKNILVNHTGLTALRDLLEDKRVLAPDEWSTLWESRMESHLSALDKRERFLALKEHILGLYEGGERRAFATLLEEAEIALGNYDVSGALEALDAAHELDRDNYELAFLLGEISFDEGDRDAALRYLARVLAIRPDHYEGLVYTGAIHYERGNPEVAEVYLRRAVEVYPEAFLPYFSLGAVYAGRGDLSLAVAYLERAVAVDGVPQALFLLGKCLYDMGKVTAAIGRLKEAVRVDPGFEDAYHLLALAYLDRHWTRKALDALKQADGLRSETLHHRALMQFILARGDAVLPEITGEAGELAAQAEESLRRGSPRQAFAGYRRALALAPEHPTLLISYALLCLRLGRGREIEAIAEQLLNQGADEILQVTAHATLIEALRNQGNYRQAQRVGEQLLAAGDSDLVRSIAYCEMAANLAEMEESLEEADEYARRAVELAPEELRHLVLATQGRVAFKRRHFAEAVAALTESNGIVCSPTTLTQLSMALLAAGEEAEAREALSHARRLRDRDGLETRMLEYVKDNRLLLEWDQRRRTL